MHVFFAVGVAEWKDLVESLVVKQPSERLGAEPDFAKLKTHPFFRGLLATVPDGRGWGGIPTMPPPGCVSI